MNNSQNFFQLVADFKKNIDWLNEVLLGDENTSVTIDGVTKPTISKDILTKFNKVNKEIDDTIKQLVNSQRSGVVAFLTYAEMLAYSPSESEKKSSFKVTNDSDKEKNGYYTFVSNTVYKKDASLVQNEVDRSNRSDAVSGYAVDVASKSALSTRDMTSSIIHNRLVNAVNGDSASSDAYDMTDYIPVNPGQVITYHGLSSGMTGGAFYDNKKVFHSSFFYPDNEGVNEIRTYTSVVPSGAEYVRASSKKGYLLTIKTPVVSAESIITSNGKNADDTLSYSEYTASLALHNVFDDYPVSPGKNINAENGVVSNNDNYYVTPFIKVKNGESFVFEGYIRSKTGFAGYDKDFRFVAPVILPDAIDPKYNTEYLTEYFFTIDNENIAYIRGCSIKSSDHAFRLLSGLKEKYLGEDVTFNDLTKSFKIFQNQGINSSTGDYFSRDDVHRTDYIPVVSGQKILFAGLARSQVGTAGYNAGKDYVVDLVGETSTGGQEVSSVLIEVPEDVSFIRSSSYNTHPISLMTTVTPGAEGLRDLITFIDLTKSAKIFKNQGINSSTGDYFSRDGVQRTDYISVRPGQRIEFVGKSQLMTGTAGYDINKSYAADLIGQGSTGGKAVYRHIIEIPENVYYLRACSYDPYDFQLNTTLEKVDDAPDSQGSDIVIRISSPTSFFVDSKAFDGSYVSHEFKYVDRPDYTDKGWYSPWVHHNGVTLGQGNFNFIHQVNKDNEVRYVGLMHGCEMFQWAKFFIDGKEFDPRKDTKTLYGSKFRIIFKSKIYAADVSASIAEGSEYTVAKVPLEERTEHYMDCTIEANSKINRYNQLRFMIDDFSFAQCMGAMQQGNKPTFTKFMINDKDAIRNEFVGDMTKALPVSPSTIVMQGIGFGNKNSFADTCTMQGESEGYDYTFTTRLINKNNAHQNRVHFRAWPERSSSTKMYFQPVYTSELEKIYPDCRINVFNTDDLLEVYSETSIDVSKK